MIVMIKSKQKSEDDCQCDSKYTQDKIFRRKRLSTGSSFIHVYIEIWDKGLLKFNKFSM